MGIPAFDEHGNLPPGYHDASPDEVRAALVDAFGASRTRSAIYDRWLRHRDALRDLVAVDEQWLAGSFCSEKPDPADADVVSVLDGEAYDALPTHRQLLVQMLIAGHYTEDFWSCDVHPLLRYPEGHPGHAASLLVAERWVGYFGHDRDGRERGLVRVAA